MALTFALAACSGGTATTGASGTPVTGGGASPSVSTPTPTATPVATPTPLPSPSGSAGSLPCPRVSTPVRCSRTPRQPRSTAAATRLGVNHLLNSGFIECVWQTPTPPSSITVQVLFTSGDTSAEEAYANNQASAHGFAVTPVANFADEAEIVRAPGGSVSTGGIYVREGSIFFDVVYLGGTVPSDGALQGAATFVLGNLP